MSVSFGEDEVYIIVGATLYRRTVSVIAMFGAGVLAIYLGVTEPSATYVWSAFMVLFGIGLFALAQRFLKATSVGIEVTNSVVRDTNGRLLCRIEDIEKVDRGAFAIKPSNGVVLTLKEPRSRVWEPGLWWCTGRKIGIGGTTAPGQSKALADAIMLIQSDGKGPFGINFKADPDARDEDEKR